MTPTALTDLEARLQSPEGAALRDALAARAAGIERRLRERIAQGLPRDAFPAWQAAAEAARAAGDILAGLPMPAAADGSPPSAPILR